MASRGIIRTIRQWCGLCLLLLLAGPPATALDPYRSLDHYGHQVWRTDSGLPQNTVHAVTQTRDGYVWLGTDGGLVRFDGVDLVTFDAENTVQFKSDTVYDLFEDSSGSLWISTGAGLLRYRSGAFEAFTMARGMPADTVWFSYEDHHHRMWAITPSGPAWFDGRIFLPVPGAQSATPANRQGLVEDAQGRLWLGGNDGVFALKSAGPTPGLALHRLNGVDVSAVALDPQGDVWIGTSGGLQRFSQNTLIAVPVSSAASDQAPARLAVTALHADGAGGMWVGTAAGLLHRASDGALLPLAANGGADTHPGNLLQGRVNSLFADRRGALWIAGERGLFRLQGNQMQSFAAGSDLAVNRVLALFEDREGSLWVGTDSDGLNLLRDQKFTTYTTSDGLSGNLVRCVFQGADGALWIGTDGAGLNRRTSTGFVHLTTADGLASNVILSLAGGAGGDVWVGTPDGLNLLHSDTTHSGSGSNVRVKRFTLTDGLPDDFIRSLFTDRDGSLWVGTRHGLSHLDQGRFSNYSSMDGLGSDFIGVIFRSTTPSQPHPSGLSGDLWIGTSGGLSRLHQGVFSNSVLPPGPANDSVTAIAQTREASPSFYLGSNGGGLLCFRQGAVAAVPSNAHALPGTIYGILEDAGGNLWLSSRTGIYRIAADALIQSAGGVPTGGIAANRVAAYGTADGMNIRECSGGGHPAAWKLADGSLWFATLDGVSMIDPGHTSENSLPPPVVLERVMVDDRVRDLHQELIIRPGTNRLEFQYAGLSFVAPQKVQYKYQLQGFDRGWIDAGTRRAAFYTNLPPGHYRFQVLAANNDGVWNLSGATFELRQLPHFYQTWWFYSSLALASLVLGYLVYRWRVLQVESRFSAVLAERGRLAREIHDTLAQGFVAVSVQLELVGRLLAGSRETPAPPVVEHLNQARDMVRASLAEARSSIWDLRSEQAPDLPSRLRQSCSRITAGTSCRVSLQVSGTYRPVERRIEEELLRIGQEAVTNALRHGAATRIDVQLVYAETQVSLRVIDDGCGFQPLSNGSGPEGHFGIRGMHERAAEIHAALVLESTPGEGTRVSVDVPLA
jgi:ligand-binding sensor domain-containing protein/signal transduction histidine kinase